MGSCMFKQGGGGPVNQEVWRMRWNFWKDRREEAFFG